MLLLHILKQILSSEIPNKSESSTCHREYKSRSSHVTKKIIWLHVISSKITQFYTDLEYLLPLFCKTPFKCHLSPQSLVPAEDYEDEDEEVTRINGQGQTEGQEEEGEDKPEWGGKGGTISDNAYTGYGQILVRQLVSTWYYVLSWDS